MADIWGDESDNYLVGTNGNDRFYGGGGNDTALFTLSSLMDGTLRVVAGGIGADPGALLVQRVNGRFVETLFTINLFDGTATVTGMNSAASFGRDVLTGVENLRFQIGTSSHGSGKLIEIGLPAPAASQTGVASPLAPAPGRSIDEIQISALSDSTFVMTYLDDRAASAVKAQRMSADGTKLGGEITLTQSGSDNGEVANVAGLSNGGFVALYDQLVGANGETGAYAKLFDASGTLVKSVSVDTLATGGAGAISLADGGFLLSWYRPVYDDYTSTYVSGLFGQVYDGSGIAVGARFEMNRGGAATQYNDYSAYETDMAALSGGGFVATWSSSDPFGDSRVFAQVFGSTGQKAGEMIWVTPGAGKGSPVVAALASGEFVIAYSHWFEANGEFLEAVEYQRYKADGTPVGERKVAQGVSGDFDIVPTASGGFVITWSQPAADYLSTTIKAQAFDSQGISVRTFDIAGPFQRDAEDAAVAPLGDGFVVAWEQEAADGSEGIGLSVFNSTSSLGSVALTGGPGNDRIEGFSGGNLLDGGFGADTMIGGAGNDTYVVDHASDRAFETSAAGGTDLVRSSVSFTLGANVENLTLTGTAVKGAGNELDNVLIGNDAANVLNGMAGADRMEGGNGSDTYYVDNVGDLVIEASAAGGVNDTVSSVVSFALGANVDHLTLIGTAADGTGNALANIIVGNASVNILTGGAGADTLKGGGGGDTMTGGADSDAYYVDNAGDIVTEAAAGGAQDWVHADVSYTLGAEVENLTLLGVNWLNGTGNGLSNRIAGNGGNNLLTGLGGNDTMFGGLGDDKMVGGDAKDTLTGGGGLDSFYFDAPLDALTNVDRITDFTAADDTIFLKRTVFAGMGAGTLSTGAFHAGTAAADAGDRIIYDSASGKIYYDADGKGGAAAVLFATVNAGTALTNADFIGYGG